MSGATSPTSRPGNALIKQKSFTSASNMASVNGESAYKAKYIICIYILSKYDKYHVQEDVK